MIGRADRDQARMCGYVRVWVVFVIIITRDAELALKKVQGKNEQSCGH